MTHPTPLPPDVIQAIEANQKIEAIKRLRQHRRLSLKEAKECVEAYEKDHPEQFASKPVATQEPRFGLGAFFIILIVLAGIALLILR